MKKLFQRLFKLTMNESSVFCHIQNIEVSYFTTRQLLTIALINSILMVGNVTANALVIYILIKTKQLLNNTCKLILVLSLSDLLIGIFVQNLFTSLLYEVNCLVSSVSQFLSVVFTHLSGYTIAIIGIDRYFRIKYYANFKAIWSRKVVLTSISTAFFLALFQAIMTEIGLLLMQEQLVTPIFIAVDVIIIIMLVFLQIQTIRTSNAVLNESTTSASKVINNKITKLSKRIMLLLCFFVGPQAIIIHISHSNITSQFSHDQKGIFEFVTCISLILIYANSFANALLFLMTNVKAKRFFRDFIRQSEMQIM